MPGSFIKKGTVIVIGIQRRKALVWEKGGVSEGSSEAGETWHVCFIFKICERKAERGAGGGGSERASGLEKA